MPSPCLNFALPQLDRRLHARLAEAQGVVVLAAELDAHRRFMPRRTLAGKRDAGPVLHLLNLRRPGHEGVLRRILWDIGKGAGYGGRGTGQKAKQRRCEDAKDSGGNRSPEHAARIASNPCESNTKRGTASNSHYEDGSQGRARHSVRAVHSQAR